MADEYKMDNMQRGGAYIFHHLCERTTDSDDLAKALHNLDFNVKVNEKQSWEEIKKELEAFMKNDHSKNDCILIAIISPDDVLNKLEKDLTYFTAENCHESLLGKPKLWFIQKLPHLPHLASDYARNYAIPIHADFLIAYSTKPEFMKSLATELESNGTKHDICTLLTFVNRRVTEDYSYSTKVPEVQKLQKGVQEQGPKKDEKVIHKQFASFTSRLTRILRFPEPFYEYTDD